MDNDLTRERLMIQVLHHLSAHSDCEANKAMAQYLASDQGMWFWTEGWRGKHFQHAGGLAAAALAGLNALRYLERTCLYLYGPVDKDRAVALFFLVLISYYRDIKTGETVEVYKDSDIARAAFLNAGHLELALSREEADAVECHDRSISEVSFGKMWWVLNQTIIFIDQMADKDI